MEHQKNHFSWKKKNILNNFLMKFVKCIIVWYLLSFMDWNISGTNLYRFISVWFELFVWYWFEMNCLSRLELNIIILDKNLKEIHLFHLLANPLAHDVCNFKLYYLDHNIGHHQFTNKKKGWLSASQKAETAKCFHCISQNPCVAF